MDEHESTEFLGRLEHGQQALGIPVLPFDMGPPLPRLPARVRSSRALAP